MKLDAFISILRGILLTKGNIDVYIQNGPKKKPVLDHSSIEVLDVPGTGTILYLRGCLRAGPQKNRET
jgi:hypothetical protein